MFILRTCVGELLKLFNLCTNIFDLHPAKKRLLPGRTRPRLYIGLETLSLPLNYPLRRICDHRCHIYRSGLIKSFACGGFSTCISQKQYKSQHIAHSAENYRPAPCLKILLRQKRFTPGAIQPCTDLYFPTLRHVVHTLGLAKVEANMYVLCMCYR